MRPIRACALSLIFIFQSSLASASPRDFCDLLLRKAGFTRDESLTRARRVARDAQKVLDRGFLRQGFNRRAASGYAMLIAGMLGSAALTAYLSASLPGGLQFLTQFLTQFSYLGVYIAAPILEPLASRFRKFAFGVPDLTPDGQPLAKESWLLHQWHLTQRRYSLNEQMTINRVGSNINALSVNFNEARDARRANDDVLAADQIAEAAYRQRLLYNDILPTNRSVAAMVWTTFANHCERDKMFLGLIWRSLQRLDTEWATDSVRAYYDTILETWMNPQWVDLSEDEDGLPAAA